MVSDFVLALKRASEQMSRREVQFVDMWLDLVRRLAPEAAPIEASRLGVPIPNAWAEAYALFLKGLDESGFWGMVERGGAANVEKAL